MRKGRASRSEGAIAILLQAVAAPGGCSYLGTGWAPWAQWFGSQHWEAWVLRTVESCTGDGHGMGYPSRKLGPSITPGKFLKICFQNPAFWCHERQKLASVGVQNGTVKREKRVLHNRMKWRIAYRGTVGAVAQAPSASPPGATTGCKV